MGREGDESIAEAAQQNELPPILDYIETVAPVGEDYLVGDRFTLADIAVAGIFANLQHLDIELDNGRHPKTADYVQRILSRPSFAPLIEKEIAILERTAPQPSPA